jgi:hypothetical protein
MMILLQENKKGETLLNFKKIQNLKWWTIDKTITKGNTCVCVCRCNERLKVKTDGSTYLTYTGFRGELEHLKIETRLIGKSFECVMGEWNYRYTVDI